MRFRWFRRAPKPTPTPTPAPAPVPVPVPTPAPVPTPGLVPAAPVTVGALTFQDEFDKTSLDRTKWVTNLGWNVNNVVSLDANVAVANNCVELKLSSPSVGALISTDPNNVSGGFTFATGYLEARILFPAANGKDDNWGAFWTTSAGLAVDWPMGGEIDIVEVLGGALTTNYHCGTKAAPQEIDSGPASGFADGQFHTFGVHRQVGKNDIYWDGVLVLSYATHDNNAPQYIVANVGNGQGDPVVSGAVILIDYVRAWALAT